MADLTASDVTYTTIRRDNVNGMKLWHGQIAYGNGALTYPTGGVPSAKEKYGFVKAILSWSVIESNANGLVYEYDISAQKIRTLEGDYANAGEGPLLELDGGSDAPAAAVLQVVAIGY